jgi:hypothetical protein
MSAAASTILRKVFSPGVVKALLFTALIMLVGAISFYCRWPVPVTFRESLLWAIKAASTSGVPEGMNESFQWFMIVYIPLGAFAWGVFLNALIKS